MKRFLFVSTILCLFTSSVFAGWTSFEKGKLFFSNASGFDQETISDKVNGYNFFTDPEKWKLAK